MLGVDLIHDALVLLVCFLVGGFFGLAGGLLAGAATLNELFGSVGENGGEVLALLVVVVGRGGCLVLLKLAAAGQDT